MVLKRGAFTFSTKNNAVINLSWINELRKTMICICTYPDNEKTKHFFSAEAYHSHIHLNSGYNLSVLELRVRRSYIQGKSKLIPKHTDFAVIQSGLL